jgi:hypothetical protein
MATGGRKRQWQPAVVKIFCGNNPNHPPALNCKNHATFLPVETGLSLATRIGEGFSRQAKTGRAWYFGANCHRKLFPLSK